MNRSLLYRLFDTEDLHLSRMGASPWSLSSHPRSRNVIHTGSSGRSIERTGRDQFAPLVHVTVVLPQRANSRPGSVETRATRRRLDPARDGVYRRGQETRLGRWGRGARERGAVVIKLRFPVAGAPAVTKLQVMQRVTQRSCRRRVAASLMPSRCTV